MKRIAIIIAAVVLTLTAIHLTACNRLKKLMDKDVQDTVAVALQSTDEDEPILDEATDYDPSDINAFGLYGHVKEVVEMTYVATKQGDKLVRGERDETNQTRNMRFQENGLVTLDIYGNEYSYDQNGKFIRGRSDASKMERAPRGLIEMYENRESSNHWEGYSYNFEYDQEGRMTKVLYTGWEEIFEYSYTYDGDKFYPNREVMEGQACADLFKSRTDYRYTRFDNHGNWLERELWVTEEQGVEDGSDSPQMDVTRKYQIEVRQITYY